MDVRWFCLAWLAVAVAAIVAPRAYAQENPDAPPADWLPPPEQPPAQASDGELADRPWQLPPLPFVHPQLFDAHTARILPAAALYGGGGLDTGGNAQAGAAFGLGDLADFGVSFTDLIRARPDADSEADDIFPYVTATLRVGVGEHRWFREQPALAIGFRKSFERETDGHTTRVAELFLALSKSVGSKLSLHAGVSLWDASLQPTGGEEIFLHDGGLRRQVRGIFGFDVEAAPHAQIMVETFWVPEFRYQEQQVGLTPRFAFGVRFAAVDWAVIESGVSVPDIDTRDLLGAQIFGRLRFTSHALARPYQQVK